MADPMDALFGAQMTAGDNQLKNIAGLIEAEDAANNEAATAEAMLADAKARRTELRNVRIPAAMLDAGMREFTTDSGLKAKVAFATDGSLGSPKTAEEFAEREAKFDLIEAHGGGEIMKQLVILSFPKDMVRHAEGVRNWMDHKITGAELNNQGALFDDWINKTPEDRGTWPISATRERAVNHMTLGSWIRSRMSEDAAEDQLPQSFLDKLGIWYGEIAKITRPKPK